MNFFFFPIQFCFFLCQAFKLTSINLHIVYLDVITFAECKFVCFSRTLEYINSSGLPRSRSFLPLLQPTCRETLFIVYCRPCLLYFVLGAGLS